MDKQSFQTDKAPEQTPPAESRELSLLQLFGDASPKTNRWEREGTPDKSGFDNLVMNAKVEVSLQELRKHNPDLPNDLLAIKLGGDHKVNHPTTGQVDAGWSITRVNEKTDSAVLSKTYKMPVKEEEDSKGLVVRLAGVAPSFQTALERKLKQLPENVISNLDKAGYKIVAAPTIPDAIPGLEKLSPRGWPADTSFENSDGTHDNISKRIIAPMRVKVGDEWRPVDREEVLVHQIGHALDFANGFLSQRREFQDAYRLDMAAAKQFNSKHPIIEYFSQPNGAGEQECFAALFGLALTGPENESDRAFLERNFPNSIKAVRAQIKDLK